MTQEELPIKAAGIIHAVASAGTCSSATVARLQALLSEKHHGSRRERPNVAESQYTVPQRRSRARNPVGSKPCREPRVTIFEEPQKPTANLSARERGSLATQIFNITLQSLTTALKESPQIQPSKVEKHTVKATAPNSCSEDAESNTKAPLKAISANRVAQLPHGKVHTHRLSTPEPNSRTPGLLAQAECACIALATLRSLQLFEASKVQTQFLQLENGMSALITKLIALGFYELAIQELKALKRSINAVHVVGNKTNTEPEGKQNENLPANLLQYSAPPSNGPLLSLIIASQFQALRLISATFRSGDIEAVLASLQIDSSNSLINLIERQVTGESPTCRAKVAQQLRSLCHLLLSICLKGSEADGRKDQRVKCCVDPKTIFQLQVLAFRTQAKWWAIARHEGNVSEETLKPFLKYLRAFCQHSLHSAPEKYRICQAGFAIISTLFNLPGSKSVRSFDSGLPPLFEILQEMARIAQECDNFSEADNWWAEAKSLLMQGEAPKHLRSALTCRMAIRYLKQPSTPRTKQDLQYQLASVANELKIDIIKSGENIDCLAIAIHELRKVILSLMCDKSNGRLVIKSQLSQQMQMVCRSILLQGLQCLHKYLVLEADFKTPSDSMLYDNEAQLVWDITKSYIESIILLAKSSNSRCEDWSLAEPALQECIRIASSFQRIADLLPEWGTRCPWNSLYVKISNIYWGRFLQLHKIQSDTESLEEALTVSIDLLQKSSDTQQLTSLLPIRLEKQGMLYETKRDPRKAVIVYEQAIRILVAAGPLDATPEAAAHRPITELFGDDGAWHHLGRLLTAYAKAAMQVESGSASGSSTVIDDEKLTCSGRGILLEQQLNAIEELLASGIYTPRPSKNLLIIASTLLSIYDKHIFPVRRLRVCCRLLRISSIQESVLSPEVLNQLPQVVRPDVQDPRDHQDDGLRLFRMHLVANYNVLAELRKDTPNLDVLNQSLGIWSDLLKDHEENRVISCYVDDTLAWSLQVELLGDWLNASGHEALRVIALRLLSSIYAISPWAQIPTIMVTLSDLGAQYTKIGNIKEAGLALHKAQRYLEKERAHCDGITVCRWYLSYAEYLLCIGSVEESKQHMQHAMDAGDKMLSAQVSSPLNSDYKHKITLLTADAASTYSRLSNTEGRSTTTVFLCRQRVKILHGVWADLQRRDNKPGSKVLTDALDASDERQLTAISSISLSEKEPFTIASATQKTPSRRHMWSLVPRLFHSLISLSKAYAYEGLFSEAQYYVEQADKVGRNVPATPYKGRFHAQAGHYKVRSDNIQASAIHFEEALGSLQAERSGYEFVRLQSYLAEKHTLEGDFISAESALRHAEISLDTLAKSLLIDSCEKTRGAEPLESRMREMTLEGCATHLDEKPHRKTMNKRSRRQGLGKADHAERASTTRPVFNSTVIRHTREYISRQRAMKAIHAGDLDSAERFLSAPAEGSLGLESFMLHTLLKAQLRLRRTMESMASDLTYSILPESTISCPAVRLPGQQHAECGAQVLPKPAVLKKCPNRKNNSRSAVGLASIADFDFRHLLKQIQVDLSNIWTPAIKSASTATIHNISDVLSTILLMLSSIGASSVIGGCNPLSMVFATEIGRIMASVREKSTILTESQLLLDDSSLKWPTDSLADSQQCLIGALLDPLTFRKEFVDIIPESWNIIAMFSSAARNEIRLVKLRRGSDVFALGIPLDRRSSQQADGEAFSLNQARAELQDIINLANYSSQSTPDTSKKGAKADWWEVRAALDARLKTLLLDIENTWFGGFRGVFHPAAGEEDLLLRFERTFQSILDRHLPSRQKQAKNSDPQHVHVDRHVLELFTALGSPNDTDLDEDLTDLLYFVVDILQFHGERNAYDEIDFDSIIVELLDALKQYHAATESSMRPANNQHTILILDKALHSFPWESLPCLKGQAVSRLPSLYFLRDRILRQGGLATTSNGQFTVKRSHGTYVLNPSGDLTATQSRFGESLSELPDWEPIVNREPKESELKVALKTRNIYLYFGHGSGGQYIRSRTIKRLDQCAVALLMGCSSGTMTEAGMYESYGTPMNYMQAGCPALVATLWDVTDKDIDRFSQTALEKWGLFENRQAPHVPATTMGSPVKKGTRRKAKQKEDTSKGGCAETMSLVQAVAESRDSCIMKYLNGAAPVVYGIPVYLSQ